ncbi:MAG TPA: SDR family NAD(P)-dependent oxidoreductase [Gemmatimonadales bacterium]|nr:SDR family NAD(P)-dependent oxidoreductase [Gemmatimonadales bacterium]
MHPIDQPTILVTGATDGLGKALARELAARGATVLLHGRSAERLAQAMHEIREVTGSERLRTYRADLASLDAVRGLAADIERDHDRLDVLVNNAAIGGGRPGSGRELSADGHELRFAVNFLAPFLLTHLLLSLLRRSAPARIVNVASVGQAPVDFDDVMLERGYDGLRAYSQSKLALIAFTFELAERLRGTAVTVNALHPASLMNTKMVYESFGYTLSTIEDGLEATLPLVIGPALEGVSGRYFDRLREARAHKQAYDPEARHRLWRLSEQLAGLASLPTVPQG